MMQKPGSKTAFRKVKGLARKLPNDKDPDHPSYSSASASTWASCLSWYSVIRSRTFLSASWNSISSMPSPLYQWRKALRLYIAPNWVARRWKMPLSAVVFATKVHDCLASLGGTVTTAVFMLLGIHSTKSSELEDWRFSMFSSTSWVDILPRKSREAVMYLPSSGLTTLLSGFP